MRITNINKLRELSLANKNPELALEWDYDKNGELTPYDVTSRTNKKVWWKCTKNPKHSWFASIASRHERGCPYCSGNLVDPDYNFGTEYPELAKLWNYSKNNKTPYDYTIQSGVKVWFICENGHSYQRRISDMVNSKTKNGCPYCHGRYATPENNFGSAYPDLVKEFDNVKNNKTPFDYTPKSPQKVWWICSTCGHSWKTSIKNRVIHNSGCPACSQSHGEKVIYNYLSLINIPFTYQKEYDGLIGVGGNNLSYDFYIPSLSLLIEYQGQFHDGTANITYQTKKRLKTQQEHDRRKREYSKLHNINLLEIWYWDFDNIEKILSSYCEN